MVLASLFDMKRLLTLCFSLFALYLLSQENYDWAVNSAQVNGYDTRVCVDTFGNSYVVFSTSGNLATPSIVVGSGPCVIRYDRHGQFSWVRKLDNMPADIAADHQGHLVLAGNTGSNQAYLHKISFQGSDIFQKIFKKHTQIRSLAVGKSGNIFFAGMAFDTLDLGPVTLTGWNRLFVAKCDMNGIGIWVTTGTVTQEYDPGDAGPIAIDKYENVYTTYQISSGCNWSSRSGWLLKLSADGNYVFHKNFNGYDGSCYGMLVEPDGHIVMNMTADAGTSHHTLALRKYKPDMSGFLWSQSVAFSQCGHLNMDTKPARNSEGDIFVGGMVGYQCGKWVSKVAFGVDTVVTDSLPDFVIARFDGQTGKHKGVWHVPASGVENVHELAADKFGNLYAAGIYNSYSICFGNHCLNTSSPSQGFLLKLKFSESEFTDSVRIGKIESINLIAPNPTNGILIIKGEYNLQKVMVYDLCGKILFETDVKDNKVDLSNLNDGLYLVQIGATEAAKFCKVVVAH
jgi:hypothetical protein